MAKNLLICSNSSKALKLNEAEESKSGRYILAGTFATLDERNRNDRIYTKEEYLKHLDYLREDIKNGESLLGELDHPEDRFEVKLKEASHKIIDLWYDKGTNTIQGKIELLNTPNGKLAQSLVDQGIPLHISSRAAGNVNSDNTVSIQQIYTYDLVAKPGFASAVLHRVDESAGSNKYTDDVRNFLKESNKMESLNAAMQYGFLNENVSIREVNYDAKLRKEAKTINMNKINESENAEWIDVIKKGVDSNSITISKDENDIPFYDILKFAKENGMNVNFNVMQIPSEVKEEIRRAYLNVISNLIECDECDCNDASCNCDKKEDVSECGVSEADGDDENDEKKDDEKSDDGEGDDEKSDDKKDDEGEGIKIIKVEAETEDDGDGEDSDDDDMFLDITADKGDDEKDEKKDDEKSDDDKKDDKEEESDKTVECGNTPKVKDAENEKKMTSANKLFDGNDVEERKEKFEDKLDDLIAALKKKNECKKESKNESLMVTQYPVSMCMNEKNFAEFASLNESQKSKVVDYLRDNNITSREGINESWKNGINYNAGEPVWLKFAPADYRKLYEQSSDTIKKSLECTASCLIFESQNDVNVFWENSGLMERQARSMANAEFINNMPKIVAVNESEELSYSKEFIKAVTEMACEYNS